jgi:hypothetical protein
VAHHNKMVCPFKWRQSGTDMKLWSDAVKESRKDIKRTFGSMKTRFRIIGTPMINRLAFCLEQIFIACCVLHNHLLDYNDADNRRERMIIVARRGDIYGMFH